MFDYRIFKLINDWAGGGGGVDLFGIFCAKYLIFVMGFAAIGIIIFREAGKKDNILSIFKIILSALLGYFIKIIINLFQARPRPFAVHDVNLLVGKLTDGSFPSMHTLISFVIAFSMYRYNKKIGVYFLVAAALVSLSRIYVGVHYPLDILGGIILAWLSVYLVGQINWKKLLKI